MKMKTNASTYNEFLHSAMCHCQYLTQHNEHVKLNLLSVQQSYLRSG
jgi:hypothetical protein